MTIGPTEDRDDTNLGGIPTSDISGCVVGLAMAQANYVLGFVGYFVTARSLACLMLSWVRPLRPQVVGNDTR